MALKNILTDVDGDGVAENTRRTPDGAAVVLSGTPSTPAWLPEGADHSFDLMGGNMWADGAERELAYWFGEGATLGEDGLTGDINSAATNALQTAFAGGTGVLIQVKDTDFAKHNSFLTISGGANPDVDIYYGDADQETEDDLVRVNRAGASAASGEFVPGGINRVALIYAGDTLAISANGAAVQTVSITGTSFTGAWFSEYGYGAFDTPHMALQLLAVLGSAVTAADLPSLSALS